MELKKSVVLGVSTLVLAGCGSSSSFVATGTQVAVPPATPSAIAGQWKGSIDGDPITLYLQQGGPVVYGKGIRFFNGAQDIIDVSGSIGDDGVGSLQLLHQDAETDLDNERMGLFAHDGVIEAAMLDGPGPTEAAFLLQRQGGDQAQASGRFLPPVSEIVASAKSDDKRSKTFRIKLNFPNGGPDGTWQIEGGASPLLSGTRGEALLLSDAQRGAVLLSVEGVDQAQLFLETGANDNSRVLKQGSRFLTSEGLFFVDSGEVDFLPGAALQADSNVSAQAAEAGDVSGHWSAVLGAGRGMELALEQAGGQLGGLVVISSAERPDGATFYVHGGVSSAGSAVLNLSPSDERDGDEVTIILQKLGQEWQAKVYDQVGKLLYDVPLARPEDQQIQGRLWDGALLPFAEFSPAEEYKFDIYIGFEPEPTPEVFETRLFSITGAALYEFVGGWSYAPESRAPQTSFRSSLSAWNPIFMPRTSFVTFKDGLGIFVESVISFPRLVDGKVGDTAEATWRVNNPFVAKKPNRYIAYRPVRLDDPPGTLWGFYSYGGRVTLLKP